MVVFVTGIAVISGAEKEESAATEASPLVVLGASSSSAGAGPE